MGENLDIKLDWMPPCALLLIIILIFIYVYLITVQAVYALLKI